MSCRRHTLSLLMFFGAASTACDSKEAPSDEPTSTGEADGEDELLEEEEEDAEGEEDAVGEEDEEDEEYEEDEEDSDDEEDEEEEVIDYEYTSFDGGWYERYSFNEKYGVVDCEGTYEMTSSTWAPGCPDCVWAFVGTYEPSDDYSGDLEECAVWEFEMGVGLVYYEGYGYMAIFGTEYGSEFEWVSSPIPAEWDGVNFSTAAGFYMEPVDYYGTYYYFTAMYYDFGVVY